MIMALVELAKLPKGQREGAGALAKRIQAPQNYLSKLLHSLAARGFLSSQRGLYGGFCLKKKPQSIKLYEVVEPIDSVTLWSGCALGFKRCSDSAPCPIHDRWKIIREQYLEFLKETTIADLL